MTFEDTVILGESGIISGFNRKAGAFRIGVTKLEFRNQGKNENGGENQAFSPPNSVFWNLGEAGGGPSLI